MSRTKIIKINPVAKNMGKFNQSKTFRNRKTDYSRKVKHSGKPDAFGYCL